MEAEVLSAKPPCPKVTEVYSGRPEAHTMFLV